MVISFKFTTFNIFLIEYCINVLDNYTYDSENDFFIVHFAHN